MLLDMGGRRRRKRRRRSLRWRKAESFVLDVVRRDIAVAKKSPKVGPASIWSTMPVARRNGMLGAAGR